MAAHPDSADAPPARSGPETAAGVRFGAVSYLNTLPLIEGLAKLEGAALHLTAPASLIDLLVQDVADVALVSSIDYQRSPVPLAIVPAGVIGSDGPTMTVRLFSRTPIDDVTRVAADADSHASVALLRIILAERYARRPEFDHFDADAHRAAAQGGDAAWPDALLLIGDKVVNDAPPGALYPHQLDLGLAWKELTGLPFVYACWMCRADRAAEPRIGAAAALLDRQRRHNAMRLDWIVEAAAPRRGWPTDLARRYLGELLRYEFDERAERALTTFFDKVHQHELSDALRPIVYAPAAPTVPT